MTNSALLNIKFFLGRIIVTAKAQQKLQHEDIDKSLRRHQAGDWGGVDIDDRHANEHGLANSGRILSTFFDRGRRKFWIITEANRLSTTVFLSEDY